MMYAVEYVHLKLVLIVFCLTIGIHSSIFETYKQSLNRGVECENLTDDSGIIQSPVDSSDNDRYLPNTERCWKIVVENGKKLKIEIQEFHVEHYNECGYDYLMIDPMYSDPLPKLCGTKKDIEEYVDLSYEGYNEVVFFFHTDHIYQLEGFKIYYNLTAKTDDSPPKEVTTRLTMGTETSGIVQMLVNNQWISVSDEGFTERHAKAICRSLGLDDSNSIAIKNSSGFFLDPSPPAVLTSQINLRNCHSRSNSFHDCSRIKEFTVAGVQCDGSYGGARIVGGPNAYTGRVEVNYGGLWGTVCHDGWTTNDAKVVCQELGLTGGETVYNHKYQGSGAIWLTFLRCQGDEDTLGNCYRGRGRGKYVGQTGCCHDYDAAVMCDPPTTTSPSTTSPSTTQLRTTPHTSEDVCTMLMEAGRFEKLDYASQENVCWILFAPMGRVEVTFEEFHVEENYDFVTIYDGSSLRNELEILHGRIGRKVVTSTGEYMRINFTSDSIITKSGFTAIFRTIDQRVMTPNECGVPAIEPRDAAGFIVGGVESNPHSHPWIAQLYSDQTCSAVIISAHYLLTAAHCVQYSVSDYQRIVVGDHNIFQEEPNQRVYRVNRVTVHERWVTDYFKGGYDIALLYVNEEIIFNEHVMPVCLPDRDTELSEGTVLTTSGWGLTFGTGNFNVLNEVQVPVIDYTACSLSSWNGRLVHRYTICAGHEDGGHDDSCLFDSGGPLTGIKDGAAILYGITSWGNGCDEQQKPGVYTKVSKFIDWINENTNGEV